MRSESAAGRLRDEVARARSWVRGRGRPARLALLALAAGAIGVAGYALWASPADRGEMVPLYGGKEFSDDQVRAIQQALAKEKIASVPIRPGQVAVAPANLADAMEAIDKHHAGPPSLEEIDRTPPESNPFDLPSDRADREVRVRERRLKAIMENYETIRAASVSIVREPVKSGPRPTWNVGCSVVLEVKRKPPHKIIEAIQKLVTSEVPGLSADAVTISDLSGHFYLKAGDPKATSTTRSLARGEELRDDLMAKLGPMIRGVEVDVRVDSPALAGHAPKPVPAAAVATAPSPSPADEPRANGPVGLGPDPSTTTAPIAPPAPEPAGAGKAHVWVKVPSSYYLNAFRDTSQGRRPSETDLAQLEQKTGALVQRAVSMTIPPVEKGEVVVTRFYDDAGAAAGPVVVPAGSGESGRGWPAWATPAAVGAATGLGVAVLVGTGFGVVASRRAPSRPSRSGVRPNLSVDAPSGPVPGPTERVREFVRRDPGAAAGVLQRWIGQGEGGPNG